MNHKTKILLVDDHPLFRRGVRALLELKPEYAVVGEASNGCEAIEFIQHTRPDVIFMDINMPRIDGLEATRIIKKDYPEINIIMLTVSDYDNALFEAIKSGGKGFGFGLLLLPITLVSHLFIIPAILTGTNGDTNQMGFLVTNSFGTIWTLFWLTLFLTTPR